MSHFLFLNASTREPGHIGNSETLARLAAASLPAATQQTWCKLADLELPPFVDLRHTAGTYPMPMADAKSMLDATLAATDLVFVSPVYWFSVPSPLKTYLDHWSAWLRVPGLEFKERMAGKRLWVIATSGNREKAQPMIDSYRLCAEFLGMQWQEPLWGKGGAPDTVLTDGDALAAAAGYFSKQSALMLVERLFLSPSRGEAQRECRQLDLLAGQGVVGDRHFAKANWAGQQLTLVEAEEIERFCAHTGRANDLSIPRRNVVTRGIRLNELVGRQFRLGSCLLVGVEPCEPCRTLGQRLANETLSAPEVVKYWVGRGGLRANVLISGNVACGDALTLIEAGDAAA